MQEAHSLPQLTWPTCTASRRRDPKLKNEKKRKKKDSKEQEEKINKSLLFLSLPPSLPVLLSMRLKEDVNPLVFLLFRVVVWLYSLLSYVPALLLGSSSSCRPGHPSQRIKARSVSGRPAGPYRDMAALDRLSTCLQPGVNTLDRVFETSARRFSRQYFLGTREVLRDEEEMQDNGKVFKKVKGRPMCVCM